MNDLLVGVSPKVYSLLKPQLQPWLRIVPIEIGAEGDSAPTVLWRRQSDRTRWVADILNANRQIRWVHTDTAGIDRLPLRELRDRNIVLSNARGVYTAAVSQWTVAAVLLVSMRLDDAVRNSDHRRWHVPHGIREFTGETVVVLGVGSIGSSIAHMCRALGMRVAGMFRGASTAKPDDPRCQAVDTVIRTVEERNVVLAEARFLVLSIPLTDQTRGMVDVEMLCHLPSDAWLINVARGEVLDETALVHALDNGRLAGAILDTFAKEPLPQDSPLWGRRNVIISAHASNHSDRSLARSFQLFLEEAERYAKGQLPINTIDYARGY